MIATLFFVCLLFIINGVVDHHSFSLLFIQDFITVLSGTSWLEPKRCSNFAMSIKNEVVLGDGMCLFNCLSCLPCKGFCTGFSVWCPWHCAPGVKIENSCLPFPAAWIVSGRARNRTWVWTLGHCCSPPLHLLFLQRPCLYLCLFLTSVSHAFCRGSLGKSYFMFLRHHPPYEWHLWVIWQS